MALVRTKATHSMTWWVGIALFVVAACALYIGRGYGRAGIMPGLAAISIMISSGVHTVSGLLFGVHANNEEWFSESGVELVGRRLGYAGVALATLVGIWLVGFHITLPIFLFLFVAIKTRRWVIAAALAFLIWAFTYVVLNQVMHIIFPASVLQDWMIAHGYF
jgi:hypothetical protein